jgi:hypothetical protein
MICSSLSLLRFMSCPFNAARTNFKGIRQEGQRQSEALLRDRLLRSFWNGLKELWAGVRGEAACQHGYAETSLFHW